MTDTLDFSAIYAIESLGGCAYRILRYADKEVSLGDIHDADHGDHCLGGGTQIVAPKGDKAARMKTCYTVHVETFRIAIADLVKPGELMPCWVITRINVPEQYRGLGYGTNLLKQILVDADEEGLILALEPLATGKGGLSQKDLIEWYKRYGFTKSKYGYMVRAPR